MSKRRGLETSRMRHDSALRGAARARDELVGRRIPIHLIEANPNQPRSSMAIRRADETITDKGVPSRFSCACAKIMIHHHSGERRFCASRRGSPRSRVRDGRS